MALSSTRPVVMSLLLLTAGASVSTADPIVPQRARLLVTSGRLLLFDPSVRPGDVELFGNAFSVDLPQLIQTTRGFGDATRDVVFPSFESKGVGSGTVQLNNTLLRFGGEPGTELQTQWIITAPPVRTRTPVSSDRPEGDFFVNYPFRLSGVLAGHTADGQSFRFDVLGNGTGQTTFTPAGLGLAADLIFNRQAPVPEPASVLLVVTGATVVLRQTRRRRTAN
jgi:hypothetical protein